VKRRALSLLLTIGLGLILADVMCPVARLDTLDLDALLVSSATSLAGFYARQLSTSTSPSIRVEIEESADPRVDGRTVRGENGCVLKMRRSTLRRPDIVAHETCHCVNDYPLLTPHGYDPSVTFDEVVRMERAAKRCAEELSK